MESFWIVVIIALPFAVAASFYMDKKLHDGNDDVQPYKWGYYNGWMGILVSGCYAIISFLNAADSYGSRADEYFSLGLLFIFVAAVSAGFVVRNKWWCIAATVVQFNPLLWIINGIYIKNRWNELNGLEKFKRPEDGDVTGDSRSSQSINEDSDDVVSFKSTEAAFEYCCRFMDTELHKNKRLPAIVLDASKHLGAKQQVPLDDHGIQRAYLRVASDDGGFTVVGHALLQNGPKLRPGDLVIWRPLKHVSEVAKKMEDPRNAWGGAIEARLRPILSAKNGWAVEERFSA